MTLLWIALTAALAQDPSGPQPADGFLPRPDVDDDVSDVVDDLREDEVDDVEPPGALDEDDAVVPEVPSPDLEVEADVEVEPADDEEPEYITVLVIGEQQISAARDQVVREMEELGWRSRRRNNGRIVFRGPESWMGRATLLPTGDLDFDVPALAVEGPKSPGGSYDPGATLDNSLNVGTVGLRMGVPSRELATNAQREIREAVRDDVLAYRRMIQQRYFSGYIAEIPNRLDELWTQGLPLDGGSPIADRAARRAAILDFWATRTDTPEGRTVMRTVEIWIRETAQDSPWPFTDAEVAAAEARRVDGRDLGLSTTAARRVE